MEHLQGNKSIFTKKFQEIKQDLLKQEGNVLKRDKCIATWLGLHNPELVTIIRKANEVYSNIAYKQSAKKLLSQEELNFIKFRDEIESSAIKVTHVTGDNQGKIIQKKKLLVNNECGTIDYGLEETLLSETTKETTIHKETETASSQEKTATATEMSTEIPNKKKIH
ncbi:43482_t:CDS:1, partial [Gigaspora margarita]